jgi:MerR family mercuric resistance operon transcriptional regulator
VRKLALIEQKMADLAGMRQVLGGLALIEQKIADLAAMRQVLGGLVQECDAGDGGAVCPIIDALNRE